MKRTALIAAAAMIGMMPLTVPAVAEDITLEFVVWNYSLDTIQDNVRKFEEQNSGIKVNVTDYTWPDYHDSLVLRFRGGTQTDVIYAGQDWLPGWAAAGFLAPLDDVVPTDALVALRADMAPFTISDMTYEGKTYGLPYYADTFSFIYNREILEENNIGVPETWEDVMQAAKALKEGGMEHPIVYEFDHELPNFLDAFIAQVYGRGGSLFDDEGRAVFDDPANAAYQQLEWLRQAFAEDIVQPETHESTVIPAMNTGRHAFTVVFNYVLAAMNNPAEQPRAGQFALALMPGGSETTMGFTKFYALTAQAASDPARAEAAWKFINFMAGKPYAVAERWAVENGLGFGQLPLFEDPDVVDAWNKWVDMEVLHAQVAQAEAGEWREWTSAWAAHFRPLLADAMVGRISVDEAMQSGAERWNSLRERMAN